MVNSKPVNQRLVPYIDTTIRYISKTRTLSGTSLNSYRERLVTVLNHAEARGLPTDPVAITRLDATRFIDELLQNGLSTDTVKLYARMLSDYAAAHANTSLRNINTHAIKPVQNRWLSGQSLDRIFATVMSIEHTLIFHLMICFGLRKRELPLLKLTDIDMDAGTLILSETGRSVLFHKVDNIIPQDTRALLEEYLDYRRNLIRWKSHLNPELDVPETLFIYDRGDMLYPFLSTSTTIDNRLREISKLTGIHLTEKVIRATSAHCMFYNNMPVEEISKIIGVKLPGNYWQEAD